MTDRGTSDASAHVAIRLKRWRAKVEFLIGGVLTGIGAWLALPQLWSVEQDGVLLGLCSFDDVRRDPLPRERVGVRAYFFAESSGAQRMRDAPRERERWLLLSGGAAALDHLREVDHARGVGVDALGCGDRRRRLRSDVVERPTREHHHLRLLRRRPQRLSESRDSGRIAVHEVIVEHDGALQLQRDREAHQGREVILRAHRERFEHR